MPGRSMRAGERLRPRLCGHRRRRTAYSKQRYSQGQLLDAMFADRGQAHVVRLQNTKRSTLLCAQTRSSTHKMARCPALRPGGASATFANQIRSNALCLCRGITLFSTERSIASNPTKPCSEEPRQSKNNCCQRKRQLRPTEAFARSCWLRAFPQHLSGSTKMELTQKAGKSMRLVKTENRRLIRAAVREKRKSWTGSPMHPKQDPKSDKICCLGSLGLCHSMGSQRHRRNKQCWLYPERCSHCQQVEVQRGEEQRSSIPEEEGSSGDEPVDHFSLSTIVVKLEDAAQSDSHGVLHDRSVYLNGIIPSVNGHKPYVNPTNVVQDALTAEDTTHCASDNLSEDKEDLDDMERRHVRSQAPSPKAQSCRKQGWQDPAMRSNVKIERDRRLDLNFVLGST